MSNTDRAEEEQDFSGFADLFNTLAQVHETNILQAIRRYSILQDLDDIEDNQGVVASTPHVTPTGTPTRTPQVSPIRADNYHLERPASSSSVPNATSDIAFSISILPLKSACSLPDISFGYLSTNTISDISYQAFDRALRAYTKVQKTVAQVTEELRTAIQDNSSNFEVEEWLATLEVVREDMNKKGRVVNDMEFDAVNPTHKEEEWQGNWETTDKKARAVIKLVTSWLQKRTVNITPTSDVVKHERLQVEPFDGDPMTWPFWMMNAKKIIANLNITD